MNALAAASVIGQALKANNNNPIGLQLPPHQRTNRLRRAASMASLHSIQSSEPNGLHVRRQQSSTATTKKVTPTDQKRQIQYQMVKKWVPSKHGLISIEVPVSVSEINQQRSPYVYRRSRNAGARNSVYIGSTGGSRTTSLRSSSAVRRRSLMESPSSAKHVSMIDLGSIGSSSPRTLSPISDIREFEFEPSIKEVSDEEEEKKTSSTPVPNEDLGKLRDEYLEELETPPVKSTVKAESRTELDIVDSYNREVTPQISPVKEKQTADKKKVEPITMAQQMRTTLGIVTPTTNLGVTPSTSLESSPLPQTPTPPSSSKVRSRKNPVPTQPIKRRSVLKNANVTKRNSNVNPPPKLDPYIKMTTAENTRLNAISSSPSLSYRSPKPQFTPVRNGIRNGAMSPRSAGSPGMMMSLRDNGRDRTPTLRGKNWKSSSRMVAAPISTRSPAPNNVSSVNTSAARMALQQYYGANNIKRQSSAKPKPRPTPTTVRAQAEELLAKAKSRPPIDLSKAFDEKTEDYNALQRTSSFERMSSRNKSKSKRLTLRDMPVEIDSSNQVTGGQFKSRFPDSDDEVEPHVSSSTRPVIAQVPEKVNYNHNHHNHHHRHHRFRLFGRHKHESSTDIQEPPKPKEHKKLSKFRKFFTN